MISEDHGRAAQRRRTRGAIVAAATQLLAQGGTPSVDDVAAAADVSRRTVYMYFPTLDQLLLDAALGALSAADVERAFTEAAAAGDDAATRVDALVRATSRLAPTTLPMGRTILRLTVESPPDGGASNPRRGYRRIGWIERAVEPLRSTLSEEQYDRLVSALAVLIGWEAMVVLRDVRGLSPEREEEVVGWAARALVAAAREEAAGGPASAGE